MIFILGFIIVIGSVVGGYLIAQGHLGVLWQPAEFIIILGSAIGATVVGTPKEVLFKSLGLISKCFQGISVTKKEYLDLLCMLYSFFKVARTKGMLALESHVENPHESAIFNNFPSVLHDEEAVEFFCDYMRMLTLGTDNHSQLEDLMNAQLETHHHEIDRMVTVYQGMADGMPALGIVAAVLGVIHTMGSINAPPAVLGHLIGAALVGTFFGVLVSYTVAAPIASILGSILKSEAKTLECIKAGILAHLQGHPPQISIEFARKSIESYFRPEFEELEEAINTLPSLS